MSGQETAMANIKESSQSEISLVGGQTLITDNKEDAYRIASGSVLVFLIPYNNDLAGKRFFLMEAGEKKVIPSFCYRDEDYREWRFAIVARDHAKLACMNHAGTSVLKKKFLISVFGDDVEDGQFEATLIDHYLTNCIREDGQIYKMRQESARIRKQLHGGSVVDSREEETVPEVWTSEIYKAVRYLCDENNVFCAEYSRITEIGGRQAGISDIAKLSEFSYHVVELKKDWWKRRLLPLVVKDNKGKIYACQPYAKGRFLIYDPDTGCIDKLKQDEASKYIGKAYAIDWVFPAQFSDYSSWISFAARVIFLSDYIKQVLLWVAKLLLTLTIMTDLNIILDTNVFFDNDLVRHICILSLCSLSCVAIHLVGQDALLDVGMRIGECLQRALYYKVFHMTSIQFRRGLRNHLSQKIFRFGETFCECFLGMMSIVWHLISGVFILIFLSYLTKIDTILIGVLFVAYSIIIILFVALRDRISKKVNQEKKHNLSRLRQMIHGITKLRSYGSIERSIYEYINRHSATDVLEARNTVFSKFVKMSLLCLSMLLLTLVLTKTGIFEWKGGIGILLLPVICILFFAYSHRIMASAGQLFRGIYGWYELYSMLFTSADSDNTELLQGKLIRRIELNNVHFKYQQDEPERIKGVSLTIQDGDYIGIVGRSGSGKSTLLKLLLGMEHPTSGKIFYNNVDLDRIERRTLRQSFGVVLQTEKLIPGSIYENIVLHDLKISQSELDRVVNMVGLNTELKALPMGLHTQVSDMGEDLSTGQIQKILLARAILNRPGVLFLDEVTSSLDDSSQANIVECLQKMDATRIVISHRLQTLRGCDRIFVMDEGEVVETGSYEELMEYRGLFYQMAERFV